MPDIPPLTLATIFVLFCTLWLLTPHVAVSVAQLHAAHDDRYRRSVNATLASLRARRQLEIRRPWALLDGTEILMLQGTEEERGAHQNRTRRWNQRVFDRVAVPGWLRRLRIWVMVD